MCLFQLSALVTLALGHSQGNGGAWSCSTAVPRMAESAPQHRISRTSSTGAIPGTTEQDLWDQPSWQQLLETSLQCHRCALGWGQRGRVTFVPLPPLGVVALPNPCLPGCLLRPPWGPVGGTCCVPWGTPITLCPSHSWTSREKILASAPVL